MGSISRPGAFLWDMIGEASDCVCVLLWRPHRPKTCTCWIWSLDQDQTSGTSMGCKMWRDGDCGAVADGWRVLFTHIIGGITRFRPEFCLRCVAALQWPTVITAAFTSSGPGLVLELLILFNYFLFFISSYLYQNQPLAPTLPPICPHENVKLQFSERVAF